MWTPTHIQVTVHKARNLKVKGGSGANDSYVVIELNDSKFRTCVKTRNATPDWNEHCDIAIPGDFVKSVVKLSVHHRNFLTTDDSLGEANIYLKHLPLYERPKRKWYTLMNRIWPNNKKPTPEENEMTGELQVTVAFMIKSPTTRSQMENADSANTNRHFQRQKSLSFRSLTNHVGMTLPSRWGSQSDLKGGGPLADFTERKFPMHSMLEMYNASRSFYDLSLSVSEDDVWTTEDDTSVATSPDDVIWASIAEDPTIAEFENGLSLKDRINVAINEEMQSGKETFLNDDERHVTASGFGAEIRRRPSLRPRSDEANHGDRKVDATERLNNVKNTVSTPSHISTPTTPVYSNNYIRDAHKRHSYVGCGENPPFVAAYRLSEIEDIIENIKFRRSLSPPSKQTTANVLEEMQSDNHQDCFEGYDREALINLVLEQQSWIQLKQAYVRDLENYVDKLLVRVLETNHQSILENPYGKIYPTGKKQQHSKQSDDFKVTIKEKLKKSRLVDLFNIWK